MPGAGSVRRTRRANGAQLWGSETGARVGKMPPLPFGAWWRWVRARRRGGRVSGRRGLPPLRAPGRRGEVSEGPGPAFARAARAAAPPKPERRAGAPAELRPRLLGAPVPRWPRVAPWPPPRPRLRPARRRPPARGVRRRVFPLAFVLALQEAPAFLRSHSRRVLASGRREGRLPRIGGPPGERASRELSH